MTAKFIPIAVPHLSGNEKKYVADCLDTTWISSNGEYINRFENMYANWLACNHALSCANGTVALHLPLVALGIKPGDEVLVPTFTYIATANAVRYCGATPVMVDCLPNTWNIDPSDVERKITPKTRGIIPVHLYGNSCDMDAIMAIAAKHNLFVVEDAAESHGATFKQKKTGTFGKAGVFSFFGNKIITTGEGGMVVTDDDELAANMRLYKGQGMDPNRRYWFPVIGYNYRMTNIEAAIGLAQLENIDNHILARRKVANLYKSFFEDYSDFFSLQVQTQNSESVWWMCSVLLKPKSKIDRDSLMKALAQDGIETRPLFYPLHTMPPYYNASALCPVSEDISIRGINLPTHALLSAEDVEFICRSLKKHVIDG